MLQHAVERATIDLPALVAATSIWAHRSTVSALQADNPTAAWFVGVRRTSPPTWRAGAA